jgi:hypothetical protein
LQTALIVAKMNAQPEATTEEYRDAESRPGEQATLTHSRSGKLALYKLTPGGSVRFMVNAPSALTVLSQPNYSDVCFDCGEPDCLAMTTVPGETSTNRCAGRPPRASRICPHPECGKRVWDTKPTGVFYQEKFATVGEDTGDPTVIRDEMYETSTPESRTASAMRLHVVGYHPQLAEELGFVKEKVMV